MHVCILDQPARLPPRRRAFRDDLAVTAECTFHWYWLADLCIEHKIHGGKNKTDKIDFEKIAAATRP